LQAAPHPPVRTARNAHLSAPPPARRTRHRPASCLHTCMGKAGEEAREAGDARGARGGPRPATDREGARGARCHTPARPLQAQGVAGATSPAESTRRGARQAAGAHAGRREGRKAQDRGASGTRCAESGRGVAHATAAHCARLSANGAATRKQTGHAGHTHAERSKQRGGMRGIGPGGGSSRTFFCTTPRRTKWKKIFATSATPRSSHQPGTGPGTRLAPSTRPTPRASARLSA